MHYQLKDTSKYILYWKHIGIHALMKGDNDDHTIIMEGQIQTWKKTILTMHAWPRLAPITRYALCLNERGRNLRLLNSGGAPEKINAITQGRGGRGTLTLQANFVGLSQARNQNSMIVSKPILDLILGHLPYYSRTKPNSGRCEGMYWEKLKSYIDQR